MPKTNQTPRARRGQLIAATGVLLLTCVMASDAIAPRGEALRAVDLVRIGTVLLLVLVLALRSTTGFRVRREGPELHDELTRANRATAARWGFWSLLTGLAACLVASLFWPLPLTEVVSILLLVGVVTATVTFTALEGRGDESD